MDENLIKLFSKALGKFLSFEEYLQLMDRFGSSADLSTDDDFHKSFSKYYDMNKKTEGWKSEYFVIFENHRRDNYADINTFNKIIEEIFNNPRMLNSQGNPNSVDASFTSKLVATLNPTMPIYDSRVIKNMGLTPVNGGTPDARFDRAKENYRIIYDRYQKYLYTADCNKAIELFDYFFPYYADKLTVTKKIDWFLWGFQREALTGLGLFDDLIN